MISSDLPMFRIVPKIAVSVYPAGPVAVDGDGVAGDDEAGVVVLEVDGIGVVAPVVEVVRELDILSFCK